VVLNSFFDEGRIVARQLPSSEGQTYDAVIVKVSSSNSSDEIILSGKAGYPGLTDSLTVDGKAILLSYGSTYKKLPFKLKLNDFTIQRYPGSRSPSSFESLVTLSDSINSLSASYRIYMLMKKVPYFQLITTAQVHLLHIQDMHYWEYV
jgi:hypothetical protein